MKFIFSAVLLLSVALPALAQCGVTGAGCTTDADCCSGFICENEFGEVVCTPGVNPTCGMTGAGCDTNADCCSGFVCQDEFGEVVCTPGP